MTGVTYSLANFIDGGPILDLPVKEGASWSALLNGPDEVSCSIDMRSSDAKALDLPSSSEPNKTVLLARTDEDVVLAWGLIGDNGRTWHEDTKTLDLSCSGILDSWLGTTAIMPVAALSAALITNDSEGFPQVNPALNTAISGVSHGTIGKRLIQQRLAFPGSPTVFDLPADQAGTREESYLFSSFKSIGSALTDITKQEGGCDFAFEAQRAPDGLSLRYVMRHGSEASPRLGTNVGVWSLGKASPITGLKLTDALAAGASNGFMSAGRTGGSPVLSRVANSAPIANGYPSMDYVDTSHSDVTNLATLDRYNRQNMADAANAVRDISFTVRGDASPYLGQYRPGDTVTIDVPDGHEWIRSSFDIRITSISGDETGETVDIGCVILDA